MDVLNLLIQKLLINVYAMPVTEALIIKLVPSARTVSIKPPLVLLLALPVLRVATRLLLMVAIAKSLTLLARTPNALLLVPAQQVH